MSSLHKGSEAAVVPTSRTANSPALIAHVIYRLGVGGLENGLVNLVNRLPPSKYRHAIICLTESTSFEQRLRARDVRVFALHKADGKDFRHLFRLWKLLRALRPDVVHTRNLTALECQVVAALAGTARRIHGEHGWDMHDLEGKNLKYNILRRGTRFFIQRYVAVSHDLGDLLTAAGVSGDRVIRICNGVDCERFRPIPGAERPEEMERFAGRGRIVIGTVGRMQEVKDQLNLVRAFLCLLDEVPSAHTRLRLALIGDGPLRPQALELLREHGAEALAWLPGNRDDIPSLLRGFDVFVLPSLKEGISNTILEAMATGLPVVATDVGGNSELVRHGETGFLVPPADAAALASALRRYIEDPQLIAAHGRAGRARAEREYSIDRMIIEYERLYEEALTSRW